MTCFLHALRRFRILQLSGFLIAVTLADTGFAANAARATDRNRRPNDSKAPAVPANATRPGVATDQPVTRQTGVIRLRDEGAITGHFVSSANEDSVHWKSPHFTLPFEFPIPNIKSVKFPRIDAMTKPSGDFTFELTNGDRLYGDLIGWNQNTLKLRTGILGELAFREAAFERIHRTENSPTGVVYPGLSGLDGWTTEAWNEDGVALWSETKGAALSADLPIPQQAKIDFEVAWKGKPSFMLAVATDSSDEEVNQTRDGWRFEIWGNILALVHEQDGVADVSEVNTLDSESERIHLIAYLDQQARELSVYTPQGRLLAKIATPKQNSETRADPESDPEPEDSPAESASGIRLVNLSGHTRLERLQIGHWSGQLPTRSEASDFRLLLKDGTTIKATTSRFDDDRNAIVVRLSSMPPRTDASVANTTAQAKDDDAPPAEKTNTDAPSQFDDSPRQSDPPTTEKRRSNERTIRLNQLMYLEQRSGVIPSTPLASTVVLLQDGTRLSGELVGVQEDRLKLRTQMLNQPIAIPKNAVRIIQVRPSNNESPPSQSATKTRDRGKDASQAETTEAGARQVTDATAGTTTSPEKLHATTKTTTAKNKTKTFDRIGILQLGSDHSRGRLVTTATTDSHAFHWHPLQSRNASPIRLQASGMLSYRDPAKPRPTTVTRAIRRREAEERRGLNFMRLFFDRIETASDVGIPKQLDLDSHRVHLVTGDVIPCDVKTITPDRVNITSTRFAATQVPSAQVKAIELVRGSSSPDLDAAKQQRLLTLPRIQKNDPPSHLLCSKTGDLLRCRILGLDASTVTVEVQLEEISIPRERLSQIIYLHPERMPPPPDEVARQLAADTAAADEAQRRPGNRDKSSISQASGNTVEGKSGGASSPVVSFAGQVQAVKSSGDRVTFKPTRVDYSKLIGDGGLIGHCEFNLGALDQILIGDAIAESIGDLPYGKWTLTHARPPLVAMDTGDSGMGADDGLGSELVGKPAPRLKLNLLDGTPFDLQEQTGRVVVLDFWASWCAPCMRTMPVLERSLAGYDPAQVMLVSVNLQQSGAEIRAVLERQGLELTVALDIDGVAAGRFKADAIPQMVVIAPDGTVDRVFVGGGKPMVDRLVQSINALLAGKK